MQIGLEMDPDVFSPLDILRDIPIVPRDRLLLLRIGGGYRTINLESFFQGDLHLL